MGRMVILKDRFDTGCLADPDGTGLLQSKDTVLWQIDGEEIALSDTAKLKEKMDRHLQRAEYEKVKFINQILCQNDFAQKKDIVDHFPEMFQIEHTDICNSRCIMCNHFFTRNHGCSFLAMDAIRGIEKYLPYTRYIALNGIGEPLLHPHIMDLLSIYEKYGIKMTTNTNLSVMNPELAAIMHRTFTDIQISCDAADKEKYEQIRRGLKFETFLKNAKMLRAAGDVEICMATVVMRQNIRDIPAIVELAADLGCQKVILLDLNTSRMLCNQDDGAASFPHTAGYYLEKAKEIADRRGIILHSLDYIRNFAAGSPEETESEKQLIQKTPLFPGEELAEKLYGIYEQLGFESPCYPALDTDYCRAGRYDSVGYCHFIENRPFISAQGDVFNCCTRRMHSMGNLNRTEFSEIWNGEALVRMRSIFNRGKLPFYCTGCTYLRSNLMVDRIRMGEVDREFCSDCYDRLRMDIIKKNLGDKANEFI